MPAPVRLLAFGGENYKPFERHFEFEVARLNVVFGRNGSGKSALLRLPLALASALSGSDSPGLPLRVRGLALGNSLLSFVHGGVIGRYQLTARFERDGRFFELEALIRHDPKSSFRLPGQWIDRWVLRDESTELANFVWTPDEGRYRSVGDQHETPVTFKGLVPIHANGSTLPIFAALRPIPRVVHLGAARGVPGEDFVPEQPSITPDVESDGGATRVVLGYLRGQAQPTLERVVKWVRECFDVDLRVEELAQGAISGTILRAKPSRRSALLPIAELGTGLGHALPLLVQYALAADQSEAAVVLCEEPEAHTHPEVHARLADIITEAVLAGQASSIVETHSETFVLRLRRRVAEGRLRPDQVAFYWLDDEDELTTLRRLQLDERGHVEDWPEGWFDAPLHEVREIQRALGAQ